MKHICRKGDTGKLVRKLIAEKKGDIRIAVLTDDDWAKNNGYQDEIAGIDMVINDVVISHTG